MLKKLIKKLFGKTPPDSKVDALTLRMVEGAHNYQIQIITVEGQSFIWHKGGKPSLLSEELAELWVKNFKLDIWEVTEKGALEPPGKAMNKTYKILRVEKVKIESSN